MGRLQDDAILSDRKTRSQIKLLNDYYECDDEKQRVYSWFIFQAGKCQQLK